MGRPHAVAPWFKRVLSDRYCSIIGRLRGHNLRGNGVYRHRRPRRLQLLRGGMTVLAREQICTHMCVRMYYRPVVHAKVLRTSRACRYMHMRHAPRNRRFRRFLGAWQTVDIRPNSMRFFSWSYTHSWYVYVACICGPIDPLSMRAHGLLLLA